MSGMMARIRTSDLFTVGGGAHSMTETAWFKRSLASSVADDLHPQCDVRRARPDPSASATSSHSDVYDPMCLLKMKLLIDCRRIAGWEAFVQCFVQTHITTLRWFKISATNVLQSRCHLGDLLALEASDCKVRNSWCSRRVLGDR